MQTQRDRRLVRLKGLVKNTLRSNVSLSSDILLSTKKKRIELALSLLGLYLLILQRVAHEVPVSHPQCRASSGAGTGAPTAASIIAPVAPPGSALIPVHFHDCSTVGPEHPAIAKC
jgi:hypothetical protein